MVFILIKSSSSQNPIADALECQAVGVNQTATLSLTIKYSKRVCQAQNAENSNTKTSSYVKINGFYDFLIDAQFPCTCSCSTDPTTTASENTCNSHGKPVCGKCVCETGWYECSNPGKATTANV
ncbi:hypothetical protein RF11_03242 [Thelohanellus kitauei]|uniref:Uncharacterized protein n=1 Tax=Thelohanellus kitauei TaxID=669202 RepID=A0A0C2MB36_THEKT|nr:hypothetical protein RF11_03242 [Thelohanellus kitauei]